MVEVALALQTKGRFQLLNSHYIDKRECLSKALTFKQALNVIRTSGETIMNFRDEPNGIAFPFLHPMRFPRKSAEKTLRHLHPNPDKEIANAAKREILRQARRSFDFYSIAIGASTIISIIGGGLILSDHAPEGALTAATSFGSIAYCAQMNKDAQEKLEALMERLEKISEG